MSASNTGLRGLANRINKLQQQGYRGVGTAHAPNHLDLGHRLHKVGYGVKYITINRNSHSPNLMSIEVKAPYDDDTPKQIVKEFAADYGGWP